MSRTPLVFGVGSERSTAEAAVSQTPDFTLDQCHGLFVTSLTHTPARTHTEARDTQGDVQAAHAAIQMPRRMAADSRGSARESCQGLLFHCPTIAALQRHICVFASVVDSFVSACLRAQLLLLLAGPPIIASFSPLISSSALANFFNLSSCHSPSSLPSKPPSGVLMQLH